MRGASVSVASNIAEGNGRPRVGEYLQFVGIAIGSLRELETQIEICHRVGYLPEAAELLAICDEVGRMLIKLRQSHQLTTA